MKSLDTTWDERVNRTYLYCSEHNNTSNGLIDQSLRRMLESFIDQTYRFTLACHRHRAATPPMTDIQKGSSDIERGHEKDRIGHGVREPFLGKRMITMGAIDWKVSATHRMDDKGWLE